MKRNFYALLSLVFTILIVIASFLCLTPVFSSFHTAWAFLCQFFSLQIIWSVFKSAFNVIRDQLKDKDN